MVSLLRLASFTAKERRRLPQWYPRKKPADAATLRFPSQWTSSSVPFQRVVHMTPAKLGRHSVSGIYSPEPDGSLSVNCLTSLYDLSVTMPLQRIVVDKPLLQVHCSLGEGRFVVAQRPARIELTAHNLGPLYDPVTTTLHFLDIEQKKVRLPPYRQRCIYALFRSTTTMLSPGSWIASVSMTP